MQTDVEKRQAAKAANLAIRHLTTALECHGLAEPVAHDLACRAVNEATWGVQRIVARLTDREAA
jgi:hypothetical protein